VKAEIASAAVAVVDSAIAGRAAKVGRVVVLVAAIVIATADLAGKATADRDPRDAKAAAVTAKAAASRRDNKNDERPGIQPGLFYPRHVADQGGARARLLRQFFHMVGGPE